MTAPGGPSCIYVVAGPNGAGKTTFARRFLPSFADCDEFVNADLIAAGLSPFAPQRQARQAGRLVLKRVEELSAEGRTFAMETTLAGLGYVHFLRDRRRTGYLVHAIFLHVPSVELAASRVAERVRSGGHDVPLADIRRRYGRGIRNFFGPYAAVFDTWTVIDNSTPDPRIVAFHDGSDLCVVEPSIFAAMRKEGVSS